MHPYKGLKQLILGGAHPARPDLGLFFCEDELGDVVPMVINASLGENMGYRRVK